MMKFTDIQSLIAPELSAADAMIQSELQSEVSLISAINAHIIEGGGKRIRPLLVLLAAKACSYKGTHHHTVAAIVEFIHTATLLHDDVVDTSTLRRGKTAAHIEYSNAAAVLTGDFLYSRAFQLMVRVDDMRVMNILAAASNKIAEGEVMQLENCKDPTVTEARYFDVIYSKTAKLFEAASELGAVLAGQPADVQHACTTYGKHIGTAFQLIDDALDYTQSADTMGKNLGDDLAEGKPTLPLIYARDNGNDAQRKIITDAIAQGNADNIDAIQKIIQETGALDYTTECATREATKASSAIECLPDSDYKNALIALTHICIDRDH